MKPPLEYKDESLQPTEEEVDEPEAGICIFISSNPISGMGGGLLSVGIKKKR